MIHPEPIGDERGFFARSWCVEETSARGLAPQVAQCNISYNLQAGTLRGLHYQAEPQPEVRVIRCTRGEIWDVIVDLRPGSGRGTWFGTELTADNRVMMYVPEGLAHGFITLTDDAEVFYQMSTPYHADLARGVRWDDPDIGIEWPLEPAVISDRDANLPLLGAVR